MKSICRSGNWGGKIMLEYSIWPSLIAASALLVVCSPILYRLFRPKKKGKKKKITLKDAYERLEINMDYVEAIDMMDNCVASRPFKRHARPKSCSEKIFYWKEISLDGYYYLKILFKDNFVKEVEFYHYFRQSDSPIVRVKSRDSFAFDAI